MNRYIRTKDGKIIKSGTQEIVLGIVKQANTIEELIEVGDLIVYIDTSLKKDSHRQPVIEKVYISQSETELCCGGTWLKYFFKDLLEIYTKQGNDYILVARKENGEWRVI